MSNRTFTVLVACTYVLIASVLTVWVIPSLRPIFGDVFPGESLPWPSRIVTSAGPVILALAVLAAPWLVFTESLRQARWLHWVLVVVLAFALTFTTAGLFWPLVKLMGQAG